MKWKFYIADNNFSDLLRRNWNQIHKQTVLYVQEILSHFAWKHFNSHFIWMLTFYIWTRLLGHTVHSPRHGSDQNTRIRIQNYCFNDHISLYILSNSITIWLTTSWTHSIRHNKWTEYDEQIVYKH